MKVLIHLLLLIIHTDFLSTIQKEFSASKCWNFAFSRYLRKAKKQSDLTHDRPMSPLQTAVYWVEFVCRHKDAGHLRVAGTDLPWYKYNLVDVILFLHLGIAFMLFIFYIACKKITHIFKMKSNITRNQKQKEKKK